MTCGLRKSEIKHCAKYLIAGVVGFITSKVCEVLLAENHWQDNPAWVYQDLVL